MSLAVSQPSSPTTYDHDAVARMLAQSLGQQKAAEVVRAAAGKLGMGERLEHAQVTALLEHVAHEPGIVGVAARFAKSRHVLRGPT